MQLRDTALAGLLGAALLLGSPGSSDAEPGKGKGNGKGWRDRDEKRVERRVERSRGSKAFRSVERRSQERRSVQRSAPRRSEDRVSSSSRGRIEDRAWSRPRSSSSRRSEGQAVRRARENRDRVVVRDGGTRETRFYERGGRVVGSREVDRDYSYRAPSRTRVQTSYRAPRWSGGRYYTGARYHTVYRGYPVYREYVSYRYAPAYAPAYGWRYYCAPRYDYHTHVVYVQPVRFFVAADFMIGGVGISARYVDPGPVYGCNFCDARFGSYHAYETHVEHDCGHLPHGYRVYADDWHDEVWDGHDEYDDGYYEE
ncbi:MAG TPA: hypothetical protein VFP58_09890 [Candidatus Eisenbacteria bacterium]|nr:hypothetical protein [Candidatus Eisenbacteria bacterium]